MKLLPPTIGVIITRNERTENAKYHLLNPTYHEPQESRFLGTTVCGRLVYRDTATERPIEDIGADFLCRKCLGAMTVE